MGRPVVHFGIGCSDRQKTGQFYADLFEWSVDLQSPAGAIDTGQPAGISGHLTALGHEPHRYIMFYVEVDDISAYLQKAASLGGKTLVPAIPIPTGMFAWFTDPEGNTIGLLQRNAERRSDQPE